MTGKPAQAVLVTGANGWAGGVLCPFLEQSGRTVIRAVRSSTAPDEITAGDINGNTDWNPVLAPRMDAVVHLAARVHQLREHDEQAAAQYWQVNTLGTLNLARQCAAVGVKRFIFISTVKVLGEGQHQPYQANGPAIPLGPYAVSKWEAEQGLLEISSQTGMQVVILRPPLVYGPGVKANFLSLLRVVDRGLPLPLGAIENQRSLIYLGNLVHAIAACIDHPAAAGKTYLISDGEDVSTPELVRHVASALERPARLLSIPPTWLQTGGSFLRKGDAVKRLLGSLCVDSRPIREELGWQPPYAMAEGLAATAQWYQAMIASSRGK